MKIVVVKDWSGYSFEEMVDILDIDPGFFMVSNAKECTDGTMLYILFYSDKIGVPHIVFNNIDCYLKKNGDYNFSVFCDTKKKKIYDKYLFKNY